MASQTRLIRLTWENGIEVKLDTRLDDGDWLIVQFMEENGHIADLWSNFQTNMEKFFSLKCTEVGIEMKA